MNTLTTNRGNFWGWILANLIICICPNLFSQTYIWGESDNYNRCHNDPQYSYCYKIDCLFSPTSIIYEMTSVSSFNSEIKLINQSRDGQQGFYIMTVLIDGVDTLIATDSLATIRCSHVPRHMLIYTTTRSHGIRIPISEDEIPSTILLVWGDNYDGHSILTIRSRRQMCFPELCTIRDRLMLGHKIAADEFYYFFSRE